MNQIGQLQGPHTEPEQKVDYEEENLKLDQKKFGHEIEKDRLEQGFSRKHLWPLATAIISLAAAVIAGAQAYIAYNTYVTNRDQTTLKYNLDKDRFDCERNYQVAQLILTNKDVVFGKPSTAQKTFQELLITTHQANAQRAFKAIALATSSDSDKPSNWTEKAKEAGNVLKRNMTLNYYACGIKDDKFRSILQSLSGQDFMKVDPHQFTKNKWISKDSTIIYYDDQNAAIAFELAQTMHGLSGNTFKVTKSTPFREILGQEQYQIFIHHIDSDVCR